MCIPLHAYQVSHPHRLDALDRALEHICRHDGVWKATGREIARHFLDHHHDDFVATEDRVEAQR
jgi:peptidoglycan/xylan/chitin deacetylase (PgdA/CDA1 family)